MAVVRKGSYEPHHPLTDTSTRWERGYDGTMDFTDLNRECKIKPPWG
jgi:hypothetical protein